MKRYITMIGLLGLVLTASPSPAAWVTNYVAIHTGGTYDGASWTTAYTNIQTAINAAPASNVIYLAGHTFSLTTPLNITRSFLTFRGGYEGTGSGPGNNDPVRWPTVITRNTSTNILLMSVSAVQSMTLDQLTFQNGRTYPASYGGAIYANNTTNLTIRFCRFIRNSVISSGTGYGGAIAAINSSGLITNSVFSGNFAASSTGHLSGMGGGIYLSGGQWTLRDLHIQGNYCAAGWGGYRNVGTVGGGICLVGAGATFSLKNLILVNNDGGGIRIESGNATLENLTVSGNDLAGISIAAAGTTIRNSILYGNRDDLNGTIPTLEYNCIGDGTSDGVNGNFASDPRFEFPLFYLATNSPCLNSGNGTVAAAGLTGTTSLTNGTADTGTVNRGYHFPQGVVFQTNLYVTTTGNDANDGSDWGDSKALRSITRALALTRSSARIHIAAGEYAMATETFPLTIDGKTVQLLGTNAENTVINASGASQRVLLVRDSPFGDNRVEKLTLRGAYPYQKGSGAGAQVDGATFSLLNSVVRQNTCVNDGSYGGGFYALAATVLISDSEFRNNISQESTGHNTSKGGAVGAYSAVTLRIRRCVFADNVSWWASNNGFAGTPIYQGGAIWLGSGHFELNNLVMSGNTNGGVVFGAAGEPTAENLTLYNHPSFGVWSVATATLKNSILWSNNRDVTGTVTVSYSDIENGQNYTDGGGNTNVNPAFVDTTYFHLKSMEANYVNGYFSGGSWSTSETNSPLIDKGDTNSVFSLEPYYNGERINMGAYGNTAVASKTRPPPSGSVFVIQ